MGYKPAKGWEFFHLHVRLHLIHFTTNVMYLLSYNISKEGHYLHGNHWQASYQQIYTVNSELYKKALTASKKQLLAS